MKPLRTARRTARRIRMRGLPGRSHGPAPSSLPLPPLFVGGTGRSGTTVIGALLGQHPTRFLIPSEAKFHSARGGLCDLLAGRTTVDAFEGLLANKWWDKGPRRGLKMWLEREAVDAALAELRQTLHDDPDRAAAVFTHRLLDPLAVAAGKPGWVEMTPTNVREGPRLAKLFPGMRLVHTVRDGRDVACSIVKQAWGPNDYDLALEWWARRLELSLSAAERMASDQLLVVQLEDLVIHDRERQFRRLLEFAGYDDDPAIRGYFEGRMTPDRAHAGRWRQDVPADRLAAFEAHHASLAAAVARRHPGYQVEVGPERMVAAG